jgi:hypothetical protein
MASFGNILATGWQHVGHLSAADLPRLGGEMAVTSHSIKLYIIDMIDNILGRTMNQRPRRWAHSAIPPRCPTTFY